jgi:hypothetical protein
VKKLSLVLVLATVLAAAPGCAAATAWWQEFQSNPVAQVQSFEQTVSIVISNAQIAFNFILPLLPANVQSKAQTDFADGVVTVNHALQVLNDAVQAAVDAKQPNPDFTAAIAAVEAAVTQVLAIVDQYKAQAPATVTAASRNTPGLAEAKDAAQSLKRYSGKF